MRSAARSGPFVEDEIVEARARQKGLLGAADGKHNGAAGSRQHSAQRRRISVHKSQQQHQLARYRSYEVPLERGCATVMHNWSGPATLGLAATHRAVLCAHRLPHLLGKEPHAHALRVRMPLQYRNSTNC